MSQKNDKKNGKNAPPKAMPKKEMHANTSVTQGVKDSVREAQNILKGSKTSTQKGKAESLLDKAFQLASDACKDDPNYSLAYCVRGQIYNQMNDFVRALYDFTVAIRIEKTANNPDYKNLAEFYNYAGVQHYELGQLEEAHKHYDLAVKYDDQQGTYKYNRGLVKSHLNKLEDAIEDYEEALKILDQAEYIYQTRFNKGICLRRLGRLNESIEDLKKATDLKGERSAALNNLGLSYFENHNYEEAIVQYKKAIQHDPSSVHHNNRGLAYYHCGKLEEAKEDFDEALKIDSNDPIIYFNRGNVYLNQGPPNFRDAHLDYDSAIRIAPNDAKLFHAKGLAFEEEADQTGNLELIDKAIEMYTKALELEEFFITSRFHLGLMYHKIHKFQDSLRCFSKVLDKIQNDKTVYIARGNVYQDMGNHQLAIRDFNQAIHIDPEICEGYYRMGLSKLRSMDAHAGIKNLDTAKLKALNEENPVEDVVKNGIPNGLGLCYHMLEQYDKALQYFDQAIEMDKTSTEFLINRSMCYYDMKKFDKSIQDLHESLQLSQNNPKIMYQLGRSYYADKQFKESIKMMKHSLINGPEMSYEADIYYHIGLAYCQLERFEKSIFPFSRCIEIIPSNFKYYHERAKALQMIEEHEKAVEDFNEVIKKNPSNAHAYFRRGFSLKSLKQFAQAANDFEKAKELDPMNPKMVVNYKKLKGITCIILCKPGDEKEFK